MAEKMSIQVMVTPTSGEPHIKEVEVAKTGASVKEIMKAAGITGKNVDVFVNGAPAGMDTHVVPTDEVQTKVKVSERPQGS